MSATTTPRSRYVPLRLDSLSERNQSELFQRRRLHHDDPHGMLEGVPEAQSGENDVRKFPTGTADFSHGGHNPTGIPVGGTDGRFPVAPVAPLMSNGLPVGSVCHFDGDVIFLVKMYLGIMVYR